MIFLDANYVLRYVVRPDTPENLVRHELATALLEATERGEEVTTSEAVLAEVAYVLASKRQYGLPPADVAARLRPILRLPGFRHPRKRQWLRALDAWATYPALGFEDALTVADVEHSPIRLATFDTDFDGIAGIARYEPPGRGGRP